MNNVYMYTGHVYTHTRVCVFNTAPQDNLMLFDGYVDMV